MNSPMVFVTIEFDSRHYYFIEYAHIEYTDTMVVSIHTYTNILIFTRTWISLNVVDTLFTIQLKYTADQIASDIIH